MLVHKGGQIKNWGGECRDVTSTKLQFQNIQRALRIFYHDYKVSKSKSETGDNKKTNRILFFLIFINSRVVNLGTTTKLC